jgi:crotonobetainyl-CoA:carnitine CoA-transferase CaiB-like acyl-CoA transferase
MESALALLSVPMARLLAGGGLTSELTGDFACYNVYRCRDGRYLSVGALEPKFWERLCGALGHPKLASRQWKRGDAARSARSTLEQAFAARDRDAWVAELRALDVCVEPVLDLEEAAREPAVGRSVAQWPGIEGTFQALSSPLRLAGSAAARRPPPRLGEHTDAVLAEAGYGGSEIATLRGQGAVA